MTITPITIIVADTQPIARNGLATMLQQVKSVEVLAQAENGDELAALCQQQMPDIVIAAAHIALNNGSNATRYIADNFPHINTIVTVESAAPAPIIIEQTCATAWISKNIKEHDLIKTIHAVHGGTTWHSSYSGCSRSVLKNAITLSVQELEIIKYLENDLTAKEISVKIKLATRTIEKYKRDLMLKLGVKGVGGMVSYAIKNNLFTTSIIYWLLLLLSGDLADLISMVPEI